eukprot:EG_transcript_18566
MCTNIHRFSWEFVCRNSLEIARVFSGALSPLLTAAVDHRWEPVKMNGDDPPHLLFALSTQFLRHTDSPRCSLPMSSSRCRRSRSLKKPLRRVGAAFGHGSSLPLVFRTSHKLS